MASSDFDAPPHAITILRCKRNGEVDVDHDALSRIFRHPDIKDKPVSIVSISGAFRKGKSFMLNFFLRYLKYRGYENSNWLGSEALLDDGFEWKVGPDACTNGILIWSQFFFMKKHGKDVAVLLMDTQGLFDHRTDNKTNTLIFALSTLISSVQIFNLSQQIQESDLGFLQLFTAYAQAAKEISPNQDVKPFQTLIFLVRDWPYGEQTSFGMDGGDKYLKTKVLISNSSSPEEIKSVRKYLNSSFDDIKCCLMPYPGKKVAYTMAFNGRLQDISKSFVQQTRAFSDKIFNPENLVVKKINGNVVTPHVILQYISDCCKIFKGGKLPTPKNMMENVAEAQNCEVQRRCGDQYQTTMEEIIGENFIDDSMLKEMHEVARQAVLQEFEDSTKFGSEASRGRYRNYLEAMIEIQYKRFNQVNKSNKTEAECNVRSTIQNLADEYERQMRQRVSESNVLSNEELEHLHGELATKAYECYSSNQDIDVRIRDQYFDNLLNKIDRSFGVIKTDNDARIKIQTEQNETKRALLKWQLEYSMQYRGELRTCTDTELQQTAEQRRRDMLDLFKLKALEMGLSEDTYIWNHHVKGLEQRLADDLKEAQRVRKEKEENFQKALEALQNKVYVEYEEIFSRMLKDSYMEIEDLLAKHKEVVDQLMEGMDRCLEFDERKLHSPLAEKYRQMTRRELNNKYSIIEEWNEKNNTFFRKSFRVVKKYVAPAVGHLVTFFKKLIL